MVSSEAHLDSSVLNGVYHFKIHDIVYHRAGPVINTTFDRKSCYAQLYFYEGGYCMAMQNE